MMTMTRDARGRFNGCEPDAETKKRIYEEDLRAERFMKALKEIGFDDEMNEKWGIIRRFEETGHFRIGYQAEWIMIGAGLALARWLRSDKKEGVEILAQVLGALGFRISLKRVETFIDQWGRYEDQEKP